MYRCFLFLISFFALTSCKAQSNQPIRQYSDAIVVNNCIWGLTTTGTIKIFKYGDGSVVSKNTDNLQGIATIVKDHKGNIVMADSSNKIFTVDSNSLKKTVIAKCGAKIYNLIFDSKNNCYALTMEGILDVTKHRSYLPKYSINSLRSTFGKMGKPYTYFIDSGDNIWMGYGYGEWGGDLDVFNTIKKRYIKLTDEYFKNGIEPVKSFFENDNTIYITTGLMHMMFFGSVIKVKDFKGTCILNASSYIHEPGGKSRNNDNAQYIGPGAYNPADGEIYFYSQSGIFKGDTRRDLSQIENWQKVVQPKLHWTNGQIDAVGSPMNILKMQFIDKNRLLFISQNDGIGLYDGDKVMMLQ